MYHSSHYRNDSPLSYTSITPTGTPELSGLSPAPRPRLRIASASLPYDENVSTHHQPQHAKTPLSGVRNNQTPSTAGGSTSSRATFWSAVGSITDEGEDHGLPPISKADSGILVSPTSPPSPMPRESISSGSTSTATTSQRSTSKSYSKSPSRRNSTQRHRRPSRQSTATSTWTASTGTTAVPPKLSRTSTETTLRSPPRAHTKPTRVEIAASLTQKYPNDRCHGAFLPFRSEFSHSKDSLCPVRFVPTASSPSTSNTGSPTLASAPFSAPQLNEKPTTASPILAEAYNGPVMYNTPIDWKGNAARRREYAAADQCTRGWRRWCCGLFGRRNDKVFWNGGDGGSVRRYRLDLPPESPDEEEVVTEKAGSRDGESGMAEMEKTIIMQKGVGMSIGIGMEAHETQESWSVDLRDERRESRHQKRSSRSV